MRELIEEDEGSDEWDSDVVGQCTGNVDHNEVYIFQDFRDERAADGNTIGGNGTGTITIESC